MAVQTTIQLRRGAAATWSSTNPVLAAGEFGLETDSSKMKMGNGASNWNSLPYLVKQTDNVLVENNTVSATNGNLVLAAGSGGNVMIGSYRVVTTDDLFDSSGTTNTATVGTITTGTWNGATIDVANGGTGATNESDARDSLGLTIGSDVQAYDATLDDVSAGTYAGDDDIATVGTVTVGTWNGATIAVANGGTGATNESDARDNLGLGSIATQDANDVNITGGSISGLDSLSISGNLFVNGTTTTINSVTVSVDDKNIELGSVDSPSDATADGGGLTLKGTTDKTLNWVDSSDAWTSSEHFDLASGKSYYINGAEVVSSSALGSGVVSSSLATVGTVTVGTWNGAVVGLTYGGTGASDASGARDNLGLKIGTNVQAYSATLDNVAAGTYAGDDDIATVGTVTAGTWNGAVVDLTYGGTGAANASDARDNLGLKIGTNVQAYSSTLDSVAAGTYAGDNDIATVGTVTTGTWNGAVVDLTYGGTGAANASDARDNLGLKIGTNVQAYSSTLDSVAAGTYAGDNDIATVGTVTVGTWNGATIAVANGGTGATNASDARDNLELGSIATQDANNVNITGGSISGLDSLSISGNLFVNGTTTTINSVTVSVDDKNIELGSVDSPSDATADGGGLTLKGTTDKTLNWVDSSDAWTSSEHFDLASGKSYYINGAEVMSSSALGSGIVSSSLATVGTVTVGTWNGATIAVANGGTGATNESDARDNLGLTIGSDVQAYDATLDDVSAGTYAGDDDIATVGTVTVGTWNGSTINAAYGGTGISSYTSGDLLYATGSTTLSKLAKGAGSQLLVMNSAGTAPEWTSTIDGGTP